MKKLHRLVYTSSRRLSCSDEEISKILAACKRNNPGKSITGVLIHSDKRFIQYLEGYEDQLKDIFEKISLDERHGGVNIRDFSPISERLFPSWHMGYKSISLQDVEFNSTISENDKMIFKKLIEGKGFNEDHGIRVLQTFFELA
jgi:hypothetical protein